MRWLTFTIFTYLMLAAEIGLGPLIEIRVATLATRPSLMLILLVYVACSAPPMVVAWVALIIGTLIDAKNIACPVFGPTALGSLLGAYTTLQFRTVFLRDSALTFASMTFITGVFLHLTNAFFLSIHDLIYPDDDWFALNDLVRNFFDLVYTIGISIPLAVLLKKVESLWSFDFDKAH